MTVQWPFMQDNLVLESRWQEHDLEVNQVHL